MRNRFDQFAKNILRDALSRSCTSEAEVEVMAASQKIDVYCVPDPARISERSQMGTLGELSADPSLFEPFHHTPSLQRVRRCLCKQLTWHHELERRARTAAGLPSQEAEPDAPQATPFPALVVIGPGRPETVLDVFACKSVQPGVYHAVAGLEMRVVVLGELPRTRATLLLLRLLGSGRLLSEALADLAALPDGAWEKSIATPLLVHLGLGSDEPATDEEEDVSEEIRAWFEDYQQKLRKEGERTGERTLLLRQLRARFGELPSPAVARVEAADVVEIERWGERVLGAKTLADVLDEPS